MMDASNNFSKRYKQHVLIETAEHLDWAAKLNCKADESSWCYSKWKWSFHLIPNKAKGWTFWLVKIWDPRSAHGPTSLIQFLFTSFLSHPLHLIKLLHAFMATFLKPFNLTHHTMITSHYLFALRGPGLWVGGPARWRPPVICARRSWTQNICSWRPYVFHQWDSSGSPGFRDFNKSLAKPGDPKRPSETLDVFVILKVWTCQEFIAPGARKHFLPPALKLGTVPKLDFAETIEVSTVYSDKNDEIAGRTRRTEDEPGMMLTKHMACANGQLKQLDACKYILQRLIEYISCGQVSQNRPASFIGLFVIASAKLPCNMYIHIYIYITYLHVYIS